MMSIIDKKIGTSYCLNCGKKLNACSSATAESMPNPGDITICLYCGHIMSFSDDMSLCELNDDQIKEIAGNPDIIKHQKIVDQARKNHKNKYN